MAITNYSEGKPQSSSGAIFGRILVGAVTGLLTAVVTGGNVMAGMAAGLMAASGAEVQGSTENTRQPSYMRG